MESPGQKPLPASISPSLALELWLEPMVAPAAMLDCPLTRAAMRKLVLWVLLVAGEDQVV